MTAWWNQSISRQSRRERESERAIKRRKRKSWGKSTPGNLQANKFLFLTKPPVNVSVVLPATINNAINEHSDDSNRSTILSAHHAFRTACYYKWPNTPYNSASFSRCPSLVRLPSYFALAIKICVMVHINYTHPATAVTTISHVWMSYQLLATKNK